MITNAPSIKIPYILEYGLFEKAEMKIAEELLVEYNDFMVFNRVQIRDTAASACAFAAHQGKVQQEPENEEETKKRAEHNRQVSLDHYENLMGSKDIAESSLVGLRIDYDTIQKVLLEERANRISIIESALNQIAPTIRAAASVLLIGERVMSDLEKLSPCVKDESKRDLAIEFAREGFELLLDGVAKGNCTIPEYHVIKRDMRKLKTLENYIGFCENLFFENRDS